jgi:uncharacterized protein (TIGR04255 family)
MRIKFSTPPINELVIAVYAKPPLVNLRAEHAGMFWSLIRSDFPQISQQSPLGLEFGFGEEVYPMPRYWFTAADDVTLIQIQKTAFIFNWRKKGSDYPHFDSVKKQFDRFFQIFLDFLRQEKIAQEFSIASCELTYVNVVNPNPLWSGVVDTANIFPGFRLVGADGLTPRNFNCTFETAPSEDITLLTNMRSARSAAASSEPALYFELKASGLTKDTAKSTADDWFERAHITIGDYFLRVTSADAHALWQKIEGSS